MKKAILYRMVMEDHICPYGLKSFDLLKRKGFEIEDHPLRDRQDVERIKDEYDVQTTPQTFIDGKRIGGYAELKEYFDVTEKGTSYKPVIAIFLTAFLMSLSVAWAIDDLTISRTIKLFVAMSMCILAVQKLQDLEAFSLQFLNYDLLAQKWVRYCYIYPFIEMFAGIAMLSEFWMPVFAPLVFGIGMIGAISVYKAVFIEKRDLKCACVGGNSNVPLGFVSLTENVMMVIMAVWMLYDWF